MSVSVYDDRAGYNSLPVSGDLDVADNEPVPHATPLGLVPGFVVGHHPGVVTVDLRRRLHEELTADEADALILLLRHHSDLSRITGAA